MTTGNRNLIAAYLRLRKLIPGADRHVKTANEMYETTEGALKKLLQRVGRLETAIGLSIEALERNSTTAPVVECLRGALRPEI